MAVASLDNGERLPGIWWSLGRQLLKVPISAGTNFHRTRTARALLKVTLRHENRGNP